MSRCSGVIREDLAHLYISVLYIRWYCRYRHGLNPVSCRCSHCVTRPYTDQSRCHPGVSRMCHGVAPIWCRFIMFLPGMITVLPGVSTVLPGVATVLLGLSRSDGTAFSFKLCFPSRRCNSNWLVSKCAWNKINIRDYLKFCHESSFTFTRLLFTDCLSRS